MGVSALFDQFSADTQQLASQGQRGPFVDERFPETSGLFDASASTRNSLQNRIDARSLGTIPLGLASSPRSLSIGRMSSGDRQQFAADRLLQSEQAPSTHVLPFPTFAPPWLTDAQIALTQLASECVMDNWDGEGNRAISAGVVALTRSFLDSLPAWVLEPVIGGDRDGRIGIDWHFGRRAVVGISISGEGAVYYASIVDGNRMSGRERFDGSIPDSVLLLLNRLRAIASSNP